MKKLLFTCLFLLLISISFLYPNEILLASKQGLLLWFEQILPALLPFSILSTLLLKTNLLNSFSFGTNDSGKNLLSIGCTMCCGFIFGFPIGAKLASDFYKENLLTQRQALYLSIATNNFSPMYIGGYVLPCLFPLSKDIMLPTYLLIYLIPLIMVTILLIFTYNKESITDTKQSTQAFTINRMLLEESIISSFLSLLKLCGYLVLFSIFSKTCLILYKEPSVLMNFLLRNLEISNGIALLHTEELTPALRYIFTIQILSFGGISGIAQTNSMFADSKLSIHKYIIGKVTLSLLLTLLSVIYVSYFIRLH